MKQMFLAVIGLALSALLFSNVAFAQTQDKTPSAADLAATESDRLAELLDLESWQVFYIDSTLQHNYGKYMEERQNLVSSKVDNYNIYMNVYDKWMAKNDEALQKYLTPEQWAKYLKNGGAKNQKAREKRQQKQEK